MKKKYPKEKFPIEVKAFIGLQARVAKGYTTTCWERSEAGFYEFLACVGKVPRKMNQPSIGRIDHSKGYEPGNCGWQEYHENRCEAVRRPENRAAQGRRVKRIWKKQRKSMIKKMSAAQTGRKHPEKVKKKIGASNERLWELGGTEALWQRSKKHSKKMKKRDKAGDIIRNPDGTFKCWRKNCA